MTKEVFNGKTAQEWFSLYSQVVINHQVVTDAVGNMLGAFDTPLTKLKMGKSWTSFHDKAVKSARDAVNSGNPLYAP